MKRTVKTTRLKSNNTAASHRRSICVDNRGPVSFCRFFFFSNKEDTRPINATHRGKLKHSWNRNRHLLPV